ncbi:MAG: DUF86 domain-containing protein [Phycisphaerales bacterium]|nr:DUF86 domain-containing protein [Phycisphaerales bacterium]
MHTICPGPRRQRLAVERRIGVIGEAARKLSDTFKAGHPDIPWREIIRQRNVISHGYFASVHDCLQRVARVEVPRLVQQLAPLVSQPLPDPEPSP